VLVFIENLERQIFRDGFERRQIGRLDHNFLTAAQQIRRPGLVAGYQDTLILNPRLQTRPAELRQALVQKGI
jgi:hypothetical protein